MPSDLNFGKDDEIEVEPSEPNIPRKGQKQRLYDAEIASYSVKGEKPIL